MLDRSEEEIAVYDEVVARYGQASALALQEQVAKALVNKGEALGKLGYHEQAIEAYNAALARDPVDDIAALAYYNRAIALFALHRWDDALHTLDDALPRFPQDHDQLDVTPADASLRLLLTSTDAQMWPERITALLACYDKHGALASLGRGLVRSVATLYSPMVSHTAAQLWRDIWHECGRGYDALTIPLRLLDAAVSYRETRDQRVLLRLPMEERKVLEQILEEGSAETE
jgi:tetratricopeptide (TPR) repeat protein